MSDPIILATSAPKDRKEYRRDFLTCLALPTGHLSSFTYRARWIEPELLAEKIDGRDAMIVFCDVPGGTGSEFEFVAFRHARVRRFRPDEVVRRNLYEGDTRIAVDFTLEHYVNVAPSRFDDLFRAWNDVLKSCEQRPRPWGHDIEDVTRFMFRLPALEEDEPRDAETAWRTLAERLAERESLKESFFFRVVALKQRRGEKELGPTGDAGELEYGLHTKDEYRLVLDAYTDVAEPALPDAIETLTTSDRLTVDQPRTRALGKGGRVEIFFTAGPVQAPTNVTVVARGRGTLEDNAPRIELPIRIRPRVGLLIVLFFFLALGLGLSGLSKTDLGVSWPAAVAIKGAGALIVGVSLFVAARNAPGVTK